MHRVVVTGLGVIAPNGLGKQAFWNGLINGTDCVDRLTDINQEGFGAQIKSFNPEEFISEDNARRMDRISQFVVAAAKLSLHDAALEVQEDNAFDIGLIVGSGHAGLDSISKFTTQRFKRGLNRVSPAVFPNTVLNAPAGYAAIECGIKGVCSTLSSLGTSALNAISYSADLLRTGQANVIVTGGFDELSDGLHLAYSRMRLTEKTTNSKINCRPFDATRRGIVLGEGAGCVVLETLDHALKRGAHIYGEIRGFCSTSDIQGETVERRIKNSALTIKSALNEANISQEEELDYISSSANSSLFTDKIETAAIKKVFGDCAYSIPVSSIKSMVGETLGASGALQLISSLLAMQENLIPPTINYEHKDEECDLDYVPNQSRAASLNTVLINSLAAGGGNSCLVVQKATMN